MSQTVVNSSYEQLQHFITSSPWSASSVKKQIAADAVKAFAPLRGQSALPVDEYSCRKQGQSSVGVARQYLGCVGKIDNGQVAVVATLAKEHYTAMAMVAELYTDGVVWDFLNADALYGHSTAFRRTVDCLCHDACVVVSDRRANCQ